jgi:hypothetical protein
MPDAATKEQLLVRLSGAGVSPERVRASDLADFLVHFERAILETALSREGVTAETLAREAMISLVSIKSGSEALMFAVAGEVLPAAALISRAVAEHDFSEIPVKAHQALHEISNQAASKDWTVEFVADPGHRIRAAVISDEEPVPPPRVVVAHGDTTIYGRLIRVGGVRPRAMLMMPDEKYLYIELTESMAVELASKERLYKDVGLEGTAKWRVDTWELLEFKAKRITAYQPGKTNLVETFEKLAQVAGDRWEGVDVEQFVAELRGRGGA